MAVTNKVERQVGKSAAALLLESRIGEQFEAMVTGASAKGNWVRLLDMPIEGMLKSGFEGIDVGDLIRVQLIFVTSRAGLLFYENRSGQDIDMILTCPFARFGSLHCRVSGSDSAGFFSNFFILQ